MIALELWICAILTYLMILSLAALKAVSEDNLSLHSPCMGIDLAQGKLAIVVPAHNEEQTIAHTLHCLTALTDPVQNSQVVVVVDNCSDLTEEVVKQLGVRALVRADQSRQGKGYALEYAFHKLLEEGFDYVAVVDADSTVSDNFLSTLRRAFGRGNRAVQARYQLQPESNSSMERLKQLLFASFNTARSLGRQTLGLSSGILGNGFALSRPLLVKHGYQAHSVVEDVEYHIQLVMGHERVHYLYDALVTAPTPPDARAASVQTARWEGGRLTLVPRLLPQAVYSLFRGNWRMTDSVLDLLTPPLSYLGLTVMLTAVFSATPIKWIPVGLSLVTLPIYLLAGCLAGQYPIEYLKSLLRIPAFVASKLLGLPNTLLNAMLSTKWKRTPRKKS